MTTRIDRLRFTARRLENPALNKDERDDISHRTYGNEIVWTRREIRGAINNIIPLCVKSRQLRQLLKTEQDKAFKNSDIISRLKEGCEAVDKAIFSWNDALDKYGQLVLTLLELYEKSGASPHDLAQVAGCNMRKVEKAYDHHKGVHSENGQENNRLFVDLIFVECIEDPVMRREPVYVLRYDWYTPLRTAIMEHFLSEMKRNDEFKKATDEALYRCFPELRGHMVTLKSDGSMEKHYPPLMLM